MGGSMDQRNDLIGILSVILVIAMLAQFALDYLRTHSIHHEVSKWRGYVSSVPSPRNLG
jgi:hypothetical protein